MLQLRETLNAINENYGLKYKDYFAAMYKGEFMALAVNSRDTGKISLS